MMRAAGDAQQVVEQGDLPLVFHRHAEVAAHRCAHVQLVGRVHEREAARPPRRSARARCLSSPAGKVQQVGLAAQRFACWSSSERLKSSVPCSASSIATACSTVNPCCSSTRNAFARKGVLGREHPVAVLLAARGQQAVLLVEPDLRRRQPVIANSLMRYMRTLLAPAPPAVVPACSIPHRRRRARSHRRARSPVRLTVAHAPPAPISGPRACRSAHASAHPQRPHSYSLLTPLPQASGDFARDCARKRRARWPVALSWAPRRATFAKEQQHARRIIAAAVGPAARRGEKKEEPQERPPFSVTDDLREAIDELTRLQGHGGEDARDHPEVPGRHARDGGALRRSSTRTSTSRSTATPSTTWSRASRSRRASSRSWALRQGAHAREHGALHHGHRGVRVICSYIHDVYNLLELLRGRDDLTIVTVKDYIADPSPTATAACTSSCAFPCTSGQQGAHPWRCSCAPSPWTSGPASSMT